MRQAKPTLLASSLSLALLAGCAADPFGSSSPADNDPPLASRDDIFFGAPKADEIPREFKADEALPEVFTELVAKQSPVKSQGRRGVCSIFAATALMEHLYLVAGATNVDFSEQYLQWSVKAQLGAFTSSSGSNAYYNLLAIDRYGIPAESAWPYEFDQWGKFDDPECDALADGDEDDTGLPWKCYTNGEPPAAAVSAPKFKLPYSTYVHPSDIKSRLKVRGTAVVVGFDFFYQSWNHRLSKLPTNSANWAHGYVLYPNEEDKRLSMEDRAGHAIVLVGWDDTLEVPIVDQEGKEVLDENGEPVVERGFYLFKNSWGTDSFGVDNEFGAGYGWISQRYVEEYGTVRADGLPDIEAPAPTSEEICDDGIDNDGNGALDCEDEVCFDAPICQPENPYDQFQYDNDSAVTIPDNDPAGVSTSVEVEDSRTIANLEIFVGIKHTYVGDLRISLHKDGQAVVLHNRTGGAADDLLTSFVVDAWNGMDMKGEWRLVVTDLAGLDTGILEGWSLVANVEKL